MNRKANGFALLVALFPGLGHFYLGKYARSLLYGFAFWIPFLAMAFAVLTRSRFDSDVEALFMLMLPLVWLIQFVDMVLTLTGGARPAAAPDGPVAANSPSAYEAHAMQRERFRTMLMSVIPGLGHFQLGLMQRGLAFLGAFFGLFGIIVFLAAASHSDKFLVFLLILPVVWIYNMADVSLQVTKKQRGEPLLDRTVFEDFQDLRAEGRKSKLLAVLLGLFPGAGHLYLGLQRRGLQLMVAFLAVLYVLDEMRLSVFLFLLPIVWFYAFFDAMGQASKLNQGEQLEDIPVVSWLLNHQKWVGIGLLALGLYYLTDQVVLPLADRILGPKLRFSLYFRQYAQTLILSVLFIGGGLKLLAGSRKKGE